MSNLEQLSDSTVQAIMENQGYVNISKWEVQLYKRMGPKHYYSVVDVAFRIAYIEALFLGISRNTHDFQKLAHLRRLQTVRNLLQEMDQKLALHPDLTFNQFNAVSDKDIMTQLYRTYRPQETVRKALPAGKDNYADLKSKPRFNLDDGWFGDHLEST